MEKIIRLLVIMIAVAAPRTVFADEQTTNTSLNEPGEVTQEMVQQDGPTVLPGMSNTSGALILTSASIIAMTALIFSSDDGSTTSGHHTPASHH